MAIVGTAHVQIRADDKYFESDIRAATRRIKNVAIQLKADVDLTKASKKIRDLRYRITSKDAVLKIDADTTKADAKMAKFLSKFLETDLQYNAVANTATASSQLTELQTRFERNSAVFNAEADTTAASAQLNFAARNRTAHINAKIDPQTSAALKGLFNTLTGTLDGAKIKAALSGVAANFEGIAMKAAALVTILGAVGAMALNAGASILSIGADITKVVGLAALFPASIGSMVAVMVANKMAWKDFGTAFDKDAKKAAAALKKLPPEAQKAVKSLRGVYTEIQKPVQKAFWKEMGTSLQDTVRNLLPQLKKGLSLVGGSWAKVLNETLGGFDRLKDGTLGVMLGNVSVMLDRMSKGMGPLIGAFNTLGKVGSTYLPQFGGWLADLAIKFEKFINKAEKTGEINRWIEEGVETVKELGSVVKSTADIFGGLSDAAKKAGAPGLVEMAASLRNIRDVVNGEPFQTRLATVLSGAREGADAMGDSFGKLTTFIGESSVAVGIFFQKAGQVAGLGFESITSLFDGTGLGSGLMSAMFGLEEALEILQPGFADLGSAIGNLGIIAGEVFKGIAPGLNQLFDTIDKVIASVKDGIIDALPVFNEFIQAILAVVQGPIVTLTTMIGDLLTGFSKLPGVIQTVMMAIGLFLLLRGPLSKMFSGMGKSLTNETTNMGRSFNKVRDGLKQMRGGVADGFSSMGAAVKNSLAETSRGFGRTFSPLVGHAQNAKEGVLGAFKQIGAGLKQGANLGPHLDDVRRGFSDLRNRVGQTSSGMVNEMRGRISDLGKAIAPAGSFLNRAGTGIRNAASGMHENLAPARAAFAKLPAAALEAGKLAGRNIGAGFRSVGSGAMEAIGGGWGLALGGATIALGLFAAEQAKAEAKVAGLADALDQQSAAFNAGAKKMLAADLLDQEATWFDDLFRSGRRNMEELARDTGMNMTKIVDTLANPEGRDEFVNNFKAIRDAQGDGKDVTDALAASVNMTKEEFEGLSQTDLDEMTRQIEGAAKSAKLAEERTLALAEATGKTTVQAAMLAKNYDVLASSTSSVSDKFAALKQNLDIAQDGLSSARVNGRDFASSMFDLEDGLKSVGTEYDGFVGKQTKFSQKFKDNLLDANGMFSVTTRGAVDFSKQMDTARDAVIQSGAAELQRLRDLGVEMPQATAGALDVMNKGAEAIRTQLKNVLGDVPAVEQIMGQLKLNPADFQAAIQVDTKNAEGDLIRFELMKGAIINGNWEVALAASTDEVKNAMLQTDVYKKAYEEGGWEAVIDVIDNGSGTVEDFMAKFAGAKTAEDVRKIIDATNPGAKVIEGAQKQIDTLNKTPVQVKEMKGVDKATAPAADALKAIKGFYNETQPLPKELLAEDKTAAGVEQATGTMGALQSVTRFLFGKDATNEGKTQAQSTMEGLTNVTRTLFGENGTRQGKTAAQITMNSLADVIRNLYGHNSAGPGKTAAQRVIDSLLGKTVDLAADGSKADGEVNRVNGLKLNDKSFNIMGVISGVSDAVRRALGFANGGIVNGLGVQTFANGGIQTPVASTSVKAFANGGIEKHIAQISRPQSGKVRIWGEEETGGEAYIPLSKAKRPRSLKILEEVARMFGMSLFKTQAFANGGIEGGSKSSNSSSMSSSGNVPAALLSSISQSLLKNSGGLNEIGLNIVQGIIGGVNDNRGTAVTAMKVLSNDLEGTVRKELDIHSPSKAFLNLGKYIVDGLAIGIKTNAGTAMKNIYTLANRIYVAASDVAKATGRSVTSSLRLLNHNKSLNVAWSKMAPAKYTDQIVDYYQKTGKTGNRTLADIVRARDDVTFRLNAANARLKTQTAAHADVVKDIASKMKSEFKLGSNILTDTVPYVPEMKFSDVKTYATGVASRLRSFNAKLQQLRKKGVSAALINEVASLGSVEGSAMADALLSGTSADIKGLNADVSAIASLSTAVGVSTADGMYKAGLDGTRGLVAGLTKDQKSLTSAANKISSTLINTVKKNLGIRSPSRVFAELGKYTTEGYIVGLDSMQPTLNRRVDSLINITPRSATPLSMNSTTNSATGTAALGATSGDPVVIQVLPSAGMDEVAVGKAAVRELNWQMLSR